MKHFFKKLIMLALKILVVLFLTIELYPVVWLFLSSFKAEPEFIKPMYALPEGVHFQNYTDAFRLSNLGVLFRNTVFVTVSSIAISLVLSAMAAFALIKMKWRLSGAAAVYLRLGMFIPAFVMLLPQFLMFKSLNLLNTLYVLIIIFGSGVAMPIYMLMGFYRYVPDEIMEASVIDGCGIYRCFFHIAAPMTLNGYVTVIMLTFFGVWNDLLISQTFVSSQSMKMLQVGLASFVGERSKREWGPTFASICIAMLPTLLLYVTLNKNIIQGLSAGAIKG